jgi:16S rRNA (cytosine1402-N4)-methyltransferase
MLKKEKIELQDIHSPVLVKEVLELLGVNRFAHLNPKAKFIDATLGLGGHSLEFLKSGIQVLGIDADPESLEKARERLRKACPGTYQKVDDFVTASGNFRNIDQIAHLNGFSKIEGILIDLGISSYQLDNPYRGFSYMDRDFPLDMRINQTDQGVKASDLLQALNKGELIKMFSAVVPEYYSVLRMTDTIVDFRKSGKIETVGDFLNIISRSGYKSRLKNNASLPFLALRIAVNSELTNLEESLPKAFDLLKSGGRLGVISFHSGEDQLVKNYFKKLEDTGMGEIVTKKPVVPLRDEVQKNSRSQSSKLRVIQRK